MLGYSIKRSLQLIVTMLGVITLVFFSIRLIPGDPSSAMAGDNLSGAAMEAIKQKLGLDAPLWIQYLDYLKHIIRFDLGTTLTTSLPIKGLILDAFPMTLMMAVFTLILSVLIAIPLGTVAAYMANKGKRTLDNILTSASMVGELIPSFMSSLLLMLLLSLTLHLLPASGTIHFDDPYMLLKRLALPVIVLSLSQISTLARITRTSVLEVLNEDYIRTARSMGLSEIVVIFRHALKNSMLPIITVIGLSFANLLNGAVIVEFIFSIPGTGTLLISGINSRDYPLVQNGILFYSFIFIAANYITDLIYKKVDPRVQI
jgi:ABC-type dipeptide/oligopeptide/nickel transport system permease component